MEYGKNKEEYSKSHAKSLSNTHNQEMRICLFTLFNIISIIKHLCLFLTYNFPGDFTNIVNLKAWLYIGH